LYIAGLACDTCGTTVGGRFPLPPLARLAPEHQAFIETFIRCRGVIRDVERALGISYPTVRTRLDAVVDALENTLEQPYLVPPVMPPVPTAPPSVNDREERRRDVLRLVEEGTLSPKDAAKLLQVL